MNEVESYVPEELSEASDFRSQLREKARKFYFSPEWKNFQSLLDVYLNLLVQAILYSKPEDYQVREQAYWQHVGARGVMAWIQSLALEEASEQ